jgi:hypothetical protein
MEMLDLEPMELSLQQGYFQYLEATQNQLSSYQCCVGMCFSDTTLILVCSMPLFG